ncbi:energy transducer TonB [Flavitalea sp. BT771]|uniref:energy transducer TonB n=1 Tax=Flavitalea sp. BT771 TaxID=3063329 RepID=UPI0026E4215E|nr:energy transducer TonB [Flavitalea sp. BT771]MDO6435521.1 energy transducer TonB [Flavitalea sp. BT771]MDV6224421.1 energy transducer TonB [Flavitalea sp. BT771]
MKPLAFTLFILAAAVTAHAQSDTTHRQYVTTVQPFTKVEIESEFPGGPKAWLEFLNSHFVYPKKAYKREIQGTVVLQFIVERDGSLSSIVALTGDPLLQEEALRVIKESPKWIPAVQDGRKVRSWKKQPIVFRLERK